MHWLIEADRRLGSSHAEQSLACQDNICHLSKGNWHSICISDGAGSSKFSEISSKFVSERFSQSLLLLADLIEVRGPGSWINDHIIYEVLELRKGLKENTDSPELDDYHCTLVAILVSQDVAIAVHIGDGAIIAGKCEDSSGAMSFLNGVLIASLPENGDYKNETFFVTEPHWLKHLRIKVLGKVDWFVMGSDGGIDILSERQKLDGPLIADLIKYISTSSDDESVVSQLIDSEFAAGKTTDDISLAIGWLGPAGAKRDLVWDEALPKSLFLDSSVNVGNLQTNLFQDKPTTTGVINDKLEDKPYSFISKILNKKSQIKLLVMLVAFIVLIFCVYLFVRSQDAEVPVEENEAALNQQLEEEEFIDGHSFNEPDEIDKPADNGARDEEGTSSEMPQDFPEMQEEPSSPEMQEELSSSIFDRMMKIWSTIFQRRNTKEPTIHELAPGSIEQI